MKYFSLVVLLLCSLHAQADITVVDPWVRTTAPGQKVAAAYLRLVSTKDTVLISANSSLAAQVELHEMQVENGVMKMRSVQNLALEANQPVELKPSGLHLMLIDIKSVVKAGDSVPITLIFQDKQGKKETVDIIANGRVYTHHH